MDTSGTYIKMCEKAEEIQDSWTPKVGDYYRRKHVPYPVIHILHSGQTATSEWDIWLPRQDQLQEMVIPEPYRDFRNLLSFFFDWVDWNNDSDKNLTQFTSMEQLWLAFVMKEKHNKVWDGKDWIS